MKYYHIRLDYYDSKLKANQTLVVTDFDNIEEIKTDYVILYLERKDLIFNGARVKGDDIRRLQIYESEYNIKKCLQIANDNVGRNVFFVYSKVSVLDYDALITNITDKITKSVQDFVKSNSMPKQANTESKKVFIVHGHDTAVRTETELMVKELGYTPVVLFKQPDKGATIIEKLEAETRDVAFAIVLYTNCDKGCSKESEEWKPRARQNVVFEHGLACGILGRNRVVALCESGVEIPGDLSGIIYKPIDNSGHWKFEVAKEMKAAGLDIDLNKLI